MERKSKLFLAMAIGVATAGRAVAQAPEPAPPSDAMVISLSILPRAALTRARPHSGHVVHDPMWHDTGTQHLVVEVLDRTTGRSIPNAQVQAIINTPGLPSVSTHLTPMSLDGRATYGGDVRLPNTRTPITIEIRVSRSLKGPAASATFSYSQGQPGTK